ncbi:MAG: hypothetical protein WC702_01160 [Patescibacteria group bacterium]|jgi:hypothetical protein
MSEINILDLWAATGIMEALLPLIREVDKRFVPEDHNLTYNQVEWSRHGDGCIGSIMLVDEDGKDQEIACYPISTRWNVDITTPHMVLAFQVTRSNNEPETEDDLSDGRWYAIPVGLAPTSIRTKVERAFQEVGLLNGRLPGLKPHEWDDSPERRFNLVFQRRRGDMIAWYQGKVCVLVEGSPIPKPGKEVICEVVTERLSKVVVRWTGMTVEQARKRIDEQRRLAGLRSSIRRAARVERPELKDPVAAMGLEPDKLSGGRLNSAYRRLRQQVPTTEEEAGANPLAKAMVEVGLPFQADNLDWPVFYAEYLDRADRAAVQVLKDKRTKEREEAERTATPPPVEPATEGEGHEEAVADLDTADEDLLVEESTDDGSAQPREEGANAK